MDHLHQIDAIISHHNQDVDKLLPVLQEIQETFHYLPPDLLVYTAQQLHYSEAAVYSAATYYPEFSLSPKGKYLIKVCDGTGCHFSRTAPLLDILWKELGLGHTKHTTEDQLFTVETCSCLGVCALVPAIMVNDKIYPSMTPENLRDLIHELRSADQH